MWLISANVCLVHITIQKILNRNRILLSSQIRLIYIYTHINIMSKDMYAKNHRQYEHFQDLVWISFILFIMQQLLDSREIMALVVQMDLTIYKNIVALHNVSSFVNTYNFYGQKLDKRYAKLQRGKHYSSWSL